MLTLSWIINEIYVNILIFVYGWTHNSLRIPKIYNTNGIWSTDQKLLTVKPIATLRQMKLWWLNDSRGNERYMTIVIYQKNLHTDLHVLSYLLFDKIWYDMALSTIISWETSPPLAFGPWQERCFQLGVEGLKPFAFWRFLRISPTSHCSGQIINSYLAKSSSFPQSILAPVQLQ